MARPFRRLASSLAYAYSAAGPAPITPPPAPAPAPAQLTLAVLAAPLQPLPPPTDAVAGSLGIARVTAVGSQVAGLAPGDLVVPAVPGIGTWRTTPATVDAAHVVPLGAPPPAAKLASIDQLAAALSWGSATAHCLMRHVPEGATVVVSGAGDGSGLVEGIVALAKTKRVRTVALVSAALARQAQVVERIKLVGADVAVAEHNAAIPGISNVIGDHPVLAIDAEGGPSATQMARMLAKGGTMVTVAGKFGNAVTVPTSALLEKNITLKGFSLQQWMQDSTPQARADLVKQVADMAVAGKISTWVKRMKMEQIADAVELCKAPQNDRSIVLLTPEGEKMAAA